MRRIMWRSIGRVGQCRRTFLKRGAHRRGLAGLTIPKLIETHTSFPVNDLVLKTFDFAGLIESLGTGIKRMMKACKENGNPPPEFRQEGSMFVATLKKKAVARRKRTTLKTTQSTTHTTTHTTTQSTTHTTTQQTSQEGFLIDVMGRVLQGNTFRVALCILQNRKAKIEDIMRDIGLTRDGVNYHIRLLKKNVGLKRIGPKFDSEWQFNLPKRLLRNVTK